MSEEKKNTADNGLSDKFYRMGAFTLIMTSIAIFFGTLYMGAKVLGIGIASSKVGIKAASVAVSNDLILKGILTAIFAMLFAIVFMLNDLLRVLNAKKL